MSNSIAPSEHEGRKVLRTQNQTLADKEMSPVPPIQDETVALASGEKRTVKVETTQDKEWDDIIALAEGSTSLSLDQKDLTHRTIAAIAALRVANEKHWKGYCLDKGVKWRKEVKSPFQPVVIWVLKRSKMKTGENHTSKASMIAGCLDEFWEVKRPQGMNPDDIAAWLDASGGYTAVYRDRLDRLRAPKDKAEVRYSLYLAMTPLEERQLPDFLSGFDGEVLISASVDRATGLLRTRSVWQPKGTSFWYSHLEKFVATRRPSIVTSTDSQSASESLSTPAES